MIFRHNYNEKTVKYAEQLIKNELFVHPFWKAVPYDQEIDWYQDPYNNVTWCFYLHSLMPVSHLMGAYELEKNPEYLEKAKEIIASWMKSNDSAKSKPSKHAWKDHSTANRVVAIVFFWYYYEKSEVYNIEFGKEILKLLHKHGEFLYDDKNYNYRNNHGVYQDRSLIELAVIFSDWNESDRWFDNAQKRLMNYIDKFVSLNGIHKEHSSHYHILMLKLLRGIDNFLIEYDKEIPELSSVICNMEEYLAYITKPNGRVPMTGDSTADAITFLNPNEIKSREMLYIRTNGKQGEKPRPERVFLEDGIAILKNDNLNGNPMYLKLLAAFNSLAHKHADDLSILLTLGKTDFFIDSGKYNYQEKSDMRKYFRSTLAHNTITVNRKSFELAKDQVGKSKIERYEINKEYSYVIASHTLYPGVEFQRTLIYLKITDSILIYDKLSSDENKIYTQVFNIGKDINVTPLSKKKVLLESKTEDIAIELQQINSVQEFKNYKGNKKNIAGWQSSQFNKKHPITQLQFTNKGTNIEYRTMIHLNRDKSLKYYSVRPLRNGVRHMMTLKDGSKFYFDILE